MIRASRTPPWDEFIPSRPEVEFRRTGGPIIVRDRVRRNPYRPMRWFEIVRGRRVVLRSQRPLAVLLTVLQPGERIYEARRHDEKGSVTGAARRRVA